MDIMKTAKDHIDIIARSGKQHNRPKSKYGNLGKNGQVYQNDLLDTDYTAGYRPTRKLV